MLLTPPPSLSLPSPPLPLHAHSSAALALIACAAGAAASEKLNLVADPLDLSNEMPHDYRNWASVLSQVRGAERGRGRGRGRRRGRGQKGGRGEEKRAAPFPALSFSSHTHVPCTPTPTPPPSHQVLLKKEGSEEAAADALGHVMLAAHGHLAKVANGEELFPRFHLADPVFAAEGHDLGDALHDVVAKVTGKVKGKVPTTSVTKFAASKTFFNFAPCVLSESKVGFAAGLTGLNFAPNLVSFFPTGLFAGIQGINVFPQLLWIQPIGVNVQPQALNVQPALIYVGPIGANVQPQGLNVQPIKIAVAVSGMEGRGREAREARPIHQTRSAPPTRVAVALLAHTTLSQPSPSLLTSLPVPLPHTAGQEGHPAPGQAGRARQAGVRGKSWRW